MPIETAYAGRRPHGRPLHYGFSASWAETRGHRPCRHRSCRGLPRVAWAARRSRLAADLLPVRAGRLARAARARAAAGALGIGVLMGYAPRSDPAEFLAVARLAAAAGAPPSPTCASSSRPTRRRRSTGPERSREPPRRRAADAPLPRQQHLAPAHRPGAAACSTTPAPHGSRSRSRPTPTGGQHRDRRVLPRARAAARVGPDAVQHRRWSAPASGSPTYAGSRSCASRPRRHLRRRVPRRATTRRTPRGAPRARSPSRTRSSRATRCRHVARRPDRLPRVAAAPGGHRRIRAPRARSPAPAADGPRDRPLELGRGVPPLLLPAGPGRRRVAPAMRKGLLVAGADADLVVIDPTAADRRATVRRPDPALQRVRHLLVGGRSWSATRRSLRSAFPGRPCGECWTDLEGDHAGGATRRVNPSGCHAMRGDNRR